MTYSENYKDVIFKTVKLFADEIRSSPFYLNGKANVQNQPLLTITKIYCFFLLNLKGLLDVTCKTVANMIKGKTPEDIRKTFNIKNDFTPSEEEQVRKENEWCEEK